MTITNDDTLDQLNAAAQADQAEWDAAFAKQFGDDPDAVTDDADRSGGTDDSGTGDSTAGPPSGEAQTQPASTPDADQGSDAPAGAGADVSQREGSAADGTFTVPLSDGSTAQLTAEQIRHMAEIAGWAQALPDETRQQFAAIEQRRAVAVDQAEYERFRGWQQSQQTQRGTSTPADPWADFADELNADQRAELNRLQQDSAELERMRMQPSQQQIVDAVVEGQRREMRFMSAQNQWADDNGLSGEEADQLLHTAIQSGAIGQFVQRHTRYSPTGQELSVDIEAAARQALDFTLFQNPDLHTRVLTARQQAAAGTGTPPQSTPTTDPVAAKKARAASVASAPSASVPQPPSDPRQMTDQQRTAAIADFIRQSTADT